MNKRTLSAVTLGFFLIALAIGVIVYGATDYGFWMVLWIILLIFGICVLGISFMYSSKKHKFGPSDSTYMMVPGILMATVGALGIVSEFSDLSVWILVAVFIIVLALVGIFVAITNGRKEDEKA